MALPEKTPEQRAEALETAMAARRERREWKARLKSGEVSLRALFGHIDDNPDATIARLRAVSALASLPGVGQTKAARLLDQAGIARGRRLRGIGKNQRKTLLALLGDRPAK